MGLGLYNLAARPRRPDGAARQAGFEAEPLMQALRITGVEAGRMTAAGAVLELANDGMAWSRSGLSHAAGVSSTVVDGLMRRVCLKWWNCRAEPVVPPPEADYGRGAFDGKGRRAMR